jgi:hypothetical protein
MFTGAKAATSSECQTSHGPAREPWKYSQPEERRRALVSEEVSLSLANHAREAPRAEWERKDAAVAADTLVLRNCRRVGMVGAGAPGF